MDERIVNSTNEGQISSVNTAYDASVGERPKGLFGEPPLNLAISREGCLYGASVYKDETVRTMLLPERESDNQTCTDSERQKSLNAEIELKVSNVAEDLKFRMLNDVFIYGEESSTERYIEQMEYHPYFTTKALLRIYLKNIENRKLAIGVAHIISNLTRSEINDEGVLIASSVVQREEPVLAKYGLIAFSSWKKREHLSIIKTLKCREQWLDDYRQYVMKQLESSHE